MEHIICKNVALGYAGRVVADEISFSVEKGDYFCIVGENGAGKSTLIKAILNLKEPMSGEIILNKEIIKNGIGYLPQQTEVQRDFPASVREIVLSGCLGKGKMFFSKADRMLAEKNMKKLGIDDLSKRCYRELSGGQQQRVLLARALCASEEILLLDEPASGLDPMATNEMYSVVSDLNKNEGITVVMVSHDIRAAIRYSKHILHIGHKPLFFGKTKDYIDSHIGRTFLGECEKESEKNE